MNKNIIILTALAIISYINFFARDIVIKEDFAQVITDDNQNAVNDAAYGDKPNSSVGNITKKGIAEPIATQGKTAKTGQEALENNKAFSRVSNFSDPSRFVEIKIDPATAAEEIDMWARQMSEHALFNQLGIEDDELKQEAKDLHTQLENFREDFNQNPEDMELMNKILPLLKEEREFQIKVLQTLDSGKWVGWIFPLFENHITLELDYFVDKLNGIKYTPEQEVTFWNRINSEHAAFAAHLFDPSERKLFLKADQFSTRFDKIPKSEKEMWIRLSLKASKELDKFAKTARAEGKKVKSIIHPVLLDHVIREGERSIKTLERLGLHKESSRFKKQYEEQLAQYTSPSEIVVAE